MPSGRVVLNTSTQYLLGKSGESMNESGSGAALKKKEKAPSVSRIIADLNAENTPKWIGPISWRHLASLRREPIDVFETVRQNSAAQEVMAGKHIVSLTQSAKRSDKGEKMRITPRAGFPIHPANLIILAVCIVVALLTAREFVTHERHRCTYREKERGKKVSLLLSA